MSRGLISYRRLVGSCFKMALDGSIIVEICNEAMAKMWRKPVEMLGFFACMLFFTVGPDHPFYVRETRG